METKELKIEAPEGYEVDWDNSSINVIRFKPIKKKITYNDIYKELFLNSACSHNGNINASSRPQLEQLLALNKLMNTAKYLNGDWEPDWNDANEDKFYIYCLFGKLSICKKQRANHGCAAFESEELALQAIEILGEEEVKKALGIFE